MSWDGRSVNFFFNISITTWYFFKTVLSPLYRGFSRLLEYSQKKIGIFLFFKKFCLNQKSLFSRKNFSKTTQYFFLIVFGPYRRVMKTSLEKLKKKIGNFSNKKISQLFFAQKNGCEKIFFSGISQKRLDISSWLF